MSAPRVFAIHGLRMASAAEGLQNLGLYRLAEAERRREELTDPYACDLSLSPPWPPLPLECLERRPHVPVKLHRRRFA